MRNGTGFLVAAMMLTPAADGVARTLAASLPAMTVACLRYLVAGLVALAVAAACGRPIAVPRRGRAGHVLRTALLMAAMTAFVAALARVPMAQAAGGFLIAPLVSGLLGVLLWAEAPTPPRLAGAAVSFAGALLLLRPEAGGGTGGLLALLGGVLLGAYLAAQRGAGDGTDALSTLAVQSLLGAVLLAPFAVAAGLPAPSGGLVAGALALGALSAACHGLTVAAYARAEATALAPFLYFNLLAAMAAGWLWFGEVPGTTALAGLAAIVAGGLLAAVPAGMTGGAPGRNPLSFRRTIG